MNGEHVNPLDKGWSRRTLMKAAALSLVAWPNVLAANTEDDPYVAEYEALLADTYQVLQSPEGRAEVTYSIQEAGDIIYGLARQVMSEQDGLAIDVEREDIMFTADDNRLAASGELNAQLKEPIYMSGEVEFDIVIRSTSDGRISLDEDTLEIDGPLALDLLNPEEAVKNTAGEDINAVLVEALNTAYLERFGDQVRAGDTRVFIDEESVTIEIVREGR